MPCSNLQELEEGGQTNPNLQIIGSGFDEQISM
jgi:hypothetical protein